MITIVVGREEGVGELRSFRICEKGYVHETVKKKKEEEELELQFDNTDKP